MTGVDVVNIRVKVASPVPQVCAAMVCAPPWHPAPIYKMGVPIYRMGEAVEKRDNSPRAASCVRGVACMFHVPSKLRIFTRHGAKRPPFISCPHPLRVPAA